jgi:hypothetical protein
LSITAVLGPPVTVIVAQAAVSPLQQDLWELDEKAYAAQQPEWWRAQELFKMVCTT